jgi:hypothetical protein
MALTGIAWSPVAAAPVLEVQPVEGGSGIGLYTWADGSWQHVSLPPVGLGLRNVTPFPFLDGGSAVQAFRPTLDGWGHRGGIGYILPSGSVPAGVGSNARLEVGGSFVQASRDESASTVPASEVGALMLAGTGQDAFLCDGVPRLGLAAACTTSSALSTHYENWQLNAGVASDFRLGAVTLSPTGALFGGAADVRQHLTQSLVSTLVPTGLVIATGSYHADLSTRWHDIGVRGGADATFEITDWLALGGGGSISVAARSASLSGSDIASSAPPPIFNGSSLVSASANAIAFTANAELGLIAKPLPALALRVFVGATYDNAVPAITSPSFGGSVNAPSSRNAAGIHFQEELDYYAGLGALIRF